MTAARVDIVIVNFNTCDHLVTCLTSLGAAPPAALNRIFVVDNASTDGSVEAVRSRWPHVTLITLESNTGFAAANNVAIRQSTAGLVLLLNSDTVVPPGAIDTLASRLGATGAVAAGPKLVDGHGRPEVSWGSMLSPLAEWRQRSRVRQAGSDAPADQAAVDAWVRDEKVVDWVSGACLLVRRDAALKVGLLDERYFMYEEDVDFCAALRAHGGRILFTPHAQVQHLRGRSVQRVGAGASQHYDRSHLLFYEKHLPQWAPLLRLWLRVRRRSVR